MSRPATGIEVRANSGEYVRVTRQIAAEAAVWVTILHGGDRDVAVENGLRSWLRISPAHREAFKRTTEVWLTLPHAMRAFEAAESQRRDAARRARRSRMRWALGVGIAMLALCVPTLLQL